MVEVVHFSTYLVQNVQSFTFFDPSSSGTLLVAYHSVQHSDLKCARSQLPPILLYRPIATDVGPRLRENVLDRLSAALSERIVHLHPVKL